MDSEFITFNPLNYYTVVWDIFLLAKVQVNLIFLGTVIFNKFNAQQNILLLNFTYNLVIN